MASRQLKPVCTVVISIRHNRQSLASMVSQKPLKIHTILWSNQCSAPQIVDNAHPHKAARNLNQTATARRSPVTLSRLVAVPELPFRTLSLPRPKRACTRVAEPSQRWPRPGCTVPVPPPAEACQQAVPALAIITQPRVPSTAGRPTPKMPTGRWDANADHSQ